jgi:hypothetical protein
LNSTNIFIYFFFLSTHFTRSFGPALVRGGTCWNNHWVYWAGPLLGSTIAAFVAQIIFLSNPQSMAAIFKSQRGREHNQSEQNQATQEGQQAQSYSVMKEEDVQLEEHA